MADDPDSDEEIIDVDLDVWAEADTDQRMRLFILKHYGAAGDPTSIEGRILVQNMESIFDWVKEGKVPAKPRSGLKIVESAKP